jgi:cell division protein ZapE
LTALRDSYAAGDDTAGPGKIVAKAFRGRCGWYRFADICDRALGRNEYLDLMRHLDTLIIEGVPVFAPGEADAALRLVTLIDICYEQRRRVIVSAAALPDALYTDGPAAPAFRRVASRLAEMQTWDERACGGRG